MTEDAMTLVDMSSPGSGELPEELPPLTAAEQDTVRELVRRYCQDLWIGVSCDLLIAS